METKAKYKTKVDASALARLMLLWEEKHRQLDELEEAIKDGVLQLGKTQTVGNVRATYTRGRRSYDYEGAIDNYHKQHPLPADFFAEHSKTVYDYRAMCNELEIGAIPSTTGAPSVSIKLLS